MHKDGRDAVARGARVVRLDQTFRWPGGRHVAVVLNVAYEGWSDGRAPGIGPMGNPLPAGAFDTNALSWGSYGATCGIERLLRALDRAKRRASVMVSGVFGERTPATVRAIVQAGHELVAHSYAQESSRRSSRPTRSAPISSVRLRRWMPPPGERPRGWISPRGTPSTESARLLVAADYAWQGDAFDDDRPYLQIFEGRPPAPIGSSRSRSPWRSTTCRTPCVSAARPSNMSSCSTARSPRCARTTVKP